MKNLRRYLHIFYLLSRYSIATAFQNKVAVAFFTIGKLIRFFMFFFFIFFLVQQTNTLKGYTTTQALIFFMTYNIVDSISQTFFREVYRFRQLVVSGELSTILVKPYPALLRVLVGGVDPMDFLISIGYVVAAAYLVSNAENSGYVGYAGYWILVANALVLATAFHIAVLGLGIITTNVDHSIMVYRDITSAGRFPLEIYKEPLRSILTFIVPVGVMMSFPSQMLFGKLNIYIACASMILTGGLLWLSLLFWKMALRRYQSWGG